MSVSWNSSEYGNIWDREYSHHVWITNFSCCSNFFRTFWTDRLSFQVTALISSIIVSYDRIIQGWKWLESLPINSSAFFSGEIQENLYNSFRHNLSAIKSCAIKYFTMAIEHDWEYCDSSLLANYQLKLGFTSDFVANLIFEFGNLSEWVFPTTATLIESNWMKT